RHQDRLEGRPPQRVRPPIPARQVPVRYLHGRARNTAAAAGSGARAGQSFSNVQARVEDVRRGTDGELRHPDQLERRAQHRNLFVRTFPEDLSLRGMREVALEPLAFQFIAEQKTLRLREGLINIFSAFFSAPPRNSVSQREPPSCFRRKQSWIL